MSIKLLPWEALRSLFWIAVKSSFSSAVVSSFSSSTNIITRMLSMKLLTTISKSSSKKHLVIKLLKKLLTITVELMKRMINL